MDFVENLFAIWLLCVLFLVGYGIVTLLGLGVMKVLDRRTGKKKWYVVGRCL